MFACIPRRHLRRVARPRSGKSRVRDFAATSLLPRADPRQRRETQVWNRGGVSPAGCDVLERFAQEEQKVQEQRTLARIPLLGDLQTAWLILLHCAAARANHLLRVVEPQSVATYAHDEGIWSCLCPFLHINPLQDEIIRSCGNLPLVVGGMASGAQHG